MLFGQVEGSGEDDEFVIEKTNKLFCCLPVAFQMANGESKPELGV